MVAAICPCPLFSRHVMNFVCWVLTMTGTVKKEDRLNRCLESIYVSLRRGFVRQCTIGWLVLLCNWSCVSHQARLFVCGEQHHTVKTYAYPVKRRVNLSRSLRPAPETYSPCAKFDKYLVTNEISFQELYEISNLFRVDTRNFTRHILR